MVKAIIILVVLSANVIIGSVLYYISGVFKSMGSTTHEELNDSDLVVSEQGELIEQFPDEYITDGETKAFNYFGQWMFILSASLLWVFMGLSVGYAAFLFAPSELMKLIVYFLVYFLFLRIPIGVANRAIEKSYDVKVMPEKVIFTILMIMAFLIGINFHELVPNFIKWQFFLSES